MAKIFKRIIKSRTKNRRYHNGLRSLQGNVVWWMANIRTSVIYHISNSSFNLVCSLCRNVSKKELEDGYYNYRY